MGVTFLIIYFYHVNVIVNGGAGELIVFPLSLGFYGIPWRTDPGVDNGGRRGSRGLARKTRG